MIKNMVCVRYWWAHQVDVTVRKGRTRVVRGWRSELEALLGAVPWDWEAHGSDILGVEQSGGGVERDMQHAGQNP